MWRMKINNSNIKLYIILQDEFYLYEIFKRDTSIDEIVSFITMVENNQESYKEKQKQLKNLCSHYYFQYTIRDGSIIIKSKYGKWVITSWNQSIEIYHGNYRKNRSNLYNTKGFHQQITLTDEYCSINYALHYISRHDHSVHNTLYGKPLSYK
ncbi:protein of unknown function [Ruminococcaceae bacterium BL-6]|nr:protein of unknown function [Ruminococcaceae bacterium BL-6]